MIILLMLNLDAWIGHLCTSQSHGRVQSLPERPVFPVLLALWVHQVLLEPVPQNQAFREMKGLELELRDTPAWVEVALGLGLRDSPGASHQAANKKYRGETMHFLPTVQIIRNTISGHVLISHIITVLCG